MSITQITNHEPPRRERRCAWCGKHIDEFSQTYGKASEAAEYHPDCFAAAWEAEQENLESEQRLGIFKAVWYAAVVVAIVVVIAWVIGGGPWN